ncbi:MAG: DUF5317 family protein [Acidimicrobiales bacterium]
MLLTASALVVGLVCGRLLGGRWQAIGGTRLERWPLLVLGLAGHVAVERADPPGAFGILVASSVALLAVVWANLRLRGMAVIGLGLAANLAVVVLNAGMPVRPEALIAAGLASPEDAEQVELRGQRRLEQEDDLLVWLGDVIPLRATGQVLSFGDLVVLAGVADVAAGLLRRRRVDEFRPTAGDLARLWPR